jgi:uncharacterized protein YigE (DUF2233 family)
MIVRSKKMLSRPLAALMMLACAVASTNQSVGSQGASTALVEVRTATWSASSGPVTIQDLSLRPGTARLRVIDIVRLPVEGNSYRTYTLREAESATKAILLVPAGASATLSMPAALGLVRTNGFATTPLSNSAFATGVFCVAQSGALSIIRAGNRAVANCRDAVQSGPIIIEPDGKPGIHKTELNYPVLTRTVVVLNKAGEVHFLVTSPAHLYDVQNFAMQALGGTAALNLGSDSGLILNEGDKQLSLGRVDAPIPAAIGVFGMSNGQQP